MIVGVAPQEDARRSGLSILSGARMRTFRSHGSPSREDMTDRELVVGGMIPGQDAESLNRPGARKSLPGPGVPPERIVKFISDEAMRFRCKESKLQWRDS